jgi:adenosylmethionine-8-amino-7-oxononanoate transaminase
LVEELVERDRRYLWHPFTPFSTWLDRHYDPTVIVKGKGCTLEDATGRRFLDGNSSIWVNLHGHRNPRIDRAIQSQLRKIAHSSFLGLTNELAPELAEKLVEFCRPVGSDPNSFPSRVFFSDDGSTAIEAAIKIIIQFFEMSGEGHRGKFVSLGRGYHGDTVGAMSVSHSDGFHGYYKKLQFESAQAMIPYCYRCPYNQAKPGRIEARAIRKCNYECINEFEKAVKECGSSFAGAVIEPLVQGAAGMVMHPHGYLAAISEITRKAGGKLILDEVMTGFYRTGSRMAFHQEACKPDILCLAKGLTAGYLPLAATIIKENLVEPFIGGPEKTFYHGHSYSGNQLGCAAALENIKILSSPEFQKRIEAKIRHLNKESKLFWSHQNVGDVRQSGMILAVEIVQDFEQKKPFDPKLRIGWKISENAKNFGLLTRSIGDVLLLMLPLSVTKKQITESVKMLMESIKNYIDK